MRNKQFVAEHRGGHLASDDHRGLINWAIACAEHALLLVPNQSVDNRLIHALDIAKEWGKGNVKTGSAMKAAWEAHASARDTANPILKSIARSIGQAVSTAHMADHSVGAALYALKAVRQAGKSIDDERAWQDEKAKKLPQKIINLIKEARNEKQQGFKDLQD